jgi:hypothetical protein
MDLRSAWALLASLLCLNAAFAISCTPGTGTLFTWGPSFDHNCTALEGDLDIDGNIFDKSILSFEVTRITGTLTIRDQKKIGTVFDLTNLTSVGNIVMDNNEGLKVKFSSNLAAASPVISVDSVENSNLQFPGMTSLESLDVKDTIGSKIDFMDLVSIAGSVSITGNLRSTVSFPKLETCLGDFSFWGNQAFGDFDLGKQEKYFGGKLVMHSTSDPIQGNFWLQNKYSLNLDNLRIAKYISIQRNTGLDPTDGFSVTMDRIKTKYVMFESNGMVSGFSLSNSLITSDFINNGGRAGIVLTHNSNVNSAMTIDLSDIELHGQNGILQQPQLQSMVQIKYNLYMKTVSMDNFNMWNQEGSVSEDLRIGLSRVELEYNSFISPDSTVELNKLNFRQGEILIKNNVGRGLGGADVTFGIDVQHIEVANLQVKYNLNLKALSLDDIETQATNTDNRACTYDGKCWFDISYNAGLQTQTSTVNFDISLTNAYLPFHSHLVMEHNSGVNDVTLTDVTLLNEVDQGFSSFSKNHVHGSFKMNRVVIPETLTVNGNDPLSHLELKYSSVERLDLTHNSLDTMKVHDVFVNNMFVKYSNSQAGLDIQLQDLWSNALDNMQFSSAGKLSGKYLAFEFNDNLKAVHLASIDAFSYAGPDPNSGAIRIRYNKEWHDVSTNGGFWTLDIENTHLYSALVITHNHELRTISISDSLFEENTQNSAIKYNENTALISISGSTIAGTAKYDAFKSKTYGSTMASLEISYQKNPSTATHINISDSTFSALNDHASLWVHHNRLAAVTIDGVQANDRFYFSHNTGTNGLHIHLEDTMATAVDTKYNTMKYFSVSDSYIGKVSLTHNRNSFKIGSSGSIHDSFVVKYQLLSQPALHFEFDSLWVGYDVNTLDALKYVTDDEYLLTHDENLVLAYNAKVDHLTISNSNLYKSTWIKYNTGDAGTAFTLSNNQHGHEIKIEGNDVKSLTLTHSLLHSGVELRGNTHLAEVAVKYVTMLNTRNDESDVNFMIKDNISQNPWPVTVTHSYLKIARSHSNGLTAELSKYAGRLSVNGNTKISSLTIDNSMIMGLPLGFQYNTGSDAAVSITNSRLTQHSKYGCGAGVDEMCFHTINANNLASFNVHNVDSTAPLMVKYNEPAGTNHLKVSIDTAFLDFQSTNGSTKLASLVPTLVEDYGDLAAKSPSSLFLKYNHKVTDIKVTNSDLVGGLRVQGTNSKSGVQAKASLHIDHVHAKDILAMYNHFAGVQVSNVEVSATSHEGFESKLQLSLNHLKYVHVTNLDGVANLSYNMLTGPNAALMIDGLVMSAPLSEFDWEYQSVNISYNTWADNVHDIAISLKNIEASYIWVDENEGISPTLPQGSPAPPPRSVTLDLENVQAMLIEVEENFYAGDTMTHIALNLNNVNVRPYYLYVDDLGKVGVQTLTVTADHIEAGTYVNIEDLYADQIQLSLSNVDVSDYVDVLYLYAKYKTPTRNSFVSLTNVHARELYLLDMEYVSATHLTGVHTSYIYVHDNKYLENIKVGPGTRFHTLDLEDMEDPSGVFTHLDLRNAEPTVVARIAYHASQKYSWPGVTAHSDAKYSGVDTAFSGISKAMFKYVLEPAEFHPLECMNAKYNLAPFAARGSAAACNAVPGCKYVNDEPMVGLFGIPAAKYRCVSDSLLRPKICGPDLKSVNAPPTPGTPIPEVTQLTQCHIKFGGLEIKLSEQALDMSAEFVFGKVDIQNNKFPAGDLRFNNIFEFYTTNTTEPSVIIANNHFGRLSIGPVEASGKDGLAFSHGEMLFTADLKGNHVSGSFQLQNMLLEKGDLKLQNQEFQNLAIENVQLSSQARDQKYGLVVKSNGSENKVNTVSIKRWPASKLEVSSNNFDGSLLGSLAIDGILGGKYYQEHSVTIDANTGLKQITLKDIKNAGNKYITNNHVVNIEVTGDITKYNEAVIVKYNTNLRGLAVTQSTVQALTASDNTGDFNTRFTVDIQDNKIADFLHLNHNKNLGNIVISQLDLAGKNNHFGISHQSLQVQHNSGEFDFTLSDLKFVSPQKYVEKFTNNNAAATPTFADYPFAFNDVSITHNDGLQATLFKDILVTGVEWSEQFGHTGPTGFEFTHNKGVFDGSPFDVSFERVTWHGQKYRTQFAVQKNDRVGSFSFKYFDLASKYFQFSHNDADITFDLSIKYSLLSSNINIVDNVRAKSFSISDTEVNLISGADETSINQLKISDNRGDFKYKLTLDLNNLMVLGSRSYYQTPAALALTPNTEKYAALVVSGNRDLKSLTMSHILTDDVVFVGSNTDQFSFALKYITGSRYVSIWENNMKDLSIDYLFAHFSMDESRQINNLESAVDGLYIAKNHGPVAISLHGLDLLAFNEMTTRSTPCNAGSSATPLANKAPNCPSSLTVFDNTASSVSIDSVQMQGTLYVAHNEAVFSDYLHLTNIHLRGRENGFVVKYNSFESNVMAYIDTNKDMAGLRGEVSGLKVAHNSGKTFDLMHVDGANPVFVDHNHFTTNIDIAEVTLGRLRSLPEFRVFHNNFQNSQTGPMSVTGINANEGFVNIADNHIINLKVEDVQSRLLYINDNAFSTPGLLASGGYIEVTNFLSNPSRKGLNWQKYKIDEATTTSKTKYAVLSLTRNTHVSGLTLKSVDISELYKTSAVADKIMSAVLIKYNTNPSRDWDLDVEDIRIEVAIKYKSAKDNAAGNISIEDNTGVSNLNLNNVKVIMPSDIDIQVTNHLVKYGPKINLYNNQATFGELHIRASEIHGPVSFEVHGNPGGSVACGDFSFDHITVDRMVLMDNDCSFSTLKWGGATFSYLKADTLVSKGNNGLEELTLQAPVDINGFDIDIPNKQTQVDLSGLVFDTTEYPGWRGNTCERLQEKFHMKMDTATVAETINTAPWTKNKYAFSPVTMGIPDACPGIDMDTTLGGHLLHKYVFASKYAVFGAKVRSFRGESTDVMDPIDGTMHKVPTSSVSYDWLLRRWGFIHEANFYEGERILNRGARDGLVISLNPQGEYTWGANTMDGRSSWSGTEATNPWMVSVQMTEEMDDGRLYSYAAEQLVLVQGNPKCFANPSASVAVQFQRADAVAPTLATSLPAKTATLDPTLLSTDYISVQGKCYTETFTPTEYFFWFAAASAVSHIPGTYDPTASTTGYVATEDLHFIGQDKTTGAVNFVYKTLPAGDWMLGVDVVDTSNGAMHRELVGEVTFDSSMAKDNSLDLDLLEQWLNAHDGTQGLYYQDQAMIMSAGHELANYHVNATEGSTMIKQLLAKLDVIRPHLRKQAGVSPVEMHRLNVASTMAAAIEAHDYLKVIDTATLKANVTDQLTALMSSSKKGRAHSMAFYREVIHAFTHLARRGATVSDLQHDLANAGLPTEPPLSANSGRRLLSHQQHDEMSEEDILFMGEVTNGMLEAMDYINGLFTDHESGEMFRYNVNHFDFAVLGFNLAKGFEASFDGGVGAPEEMAAAKIEIKAAGLFDHNYRAQVLSTPVVHTPGHRIVTGLTSLALKDETGATLTGAVSDLVYDNGVYVYVPIDPTVPACAEYQCLSYDHTASVDIWKKDNLYGTSVRDGDHLKCRLTGDAVVVGACTPRGSIVGDPYVFAPQSDKWVPFHPSNDQLYSLVEGKDFHVQGGFAAATKASCQCVWVDEDPSQAPRAGNRLAAVIFEFNGGVFHITPTGLFYEQAGEWMEVPKAEWSPAQLASGDASLTTGASGELIVNDVQIEWGAVAKQESFPWGQHDYTYKFEAKIPRAGLLTVLAGVDSGINVMDVHFEPKAQTSVGGLIGAALSSGEAGIESFAAKALP